MFGLRKVTHAAVFDIASGSVGVALITHHHTKSTSPTIEALTRVPIIFHDTYTPGGLAKDLRTALRHAVAFLQKELAARQLSPRRLDAHVLVHAPWATVTAKTEEVFFDDAPTFSDSFFSSFLAQTYPEFGETSPEAHLVASRVVTVRLNGYPITAPMPASVQSLEVGLLRFLMHPMVRRSIEETLDGLLNVKSMQLESFMHAVMALARKNSTAHYSLLDLGEVYTQLVTIDDEAIRTRAEVDFGVRDVYAAIADRLKTTPETARDALRMYLEDTIIPTTRKRLEKVLTRVISRFTDALQKAVEESATHDALPSRMFVTGDRFITPLLKEAIESVALASFTEHKKPFRISPLIAPSQTQKFYDISLDARDERLLLAALYVDRVAPALATHPLLVRVVQPTPHPEAAS